jgi:predicted transcriptional regulator
MKKSMVFEAVATLLLILLIFAIYVMIAGSAPTITEKWNTTMGRAPYLFVGDNDVLYVFNDNHISSIAPDGNVRWSVSVPDNWTIINEWTLYTLSNPTDLVFSGDSRVHREGVGYLGTLWNGYRSESTPAVASNNGILYVYVRPSFYFNDSHEDGNVTLGLERAFGTEWSKSLSYARLMAISPDGKVLWTKPLDNVTNDNPDTGWLPIEDLFISASGDRIYAYHPNSLSVLDDDGSFLFRIDNVSDVAAIDELGIIFTVEVAADGQPSNMVAAYYPNGTLWWKKAMKEPVRRQMLDVSVKPGYWTLPVYMNDTLYVPLKKSLVALDKNGNELWSNNFEWDVSLLWMMPFDSQNNAYLLVHTKPVPGNDGVVYQGKLAAPDGKLSDYTILRDSASLYSAGNGIGYYLYSGNWFTRSTMIYEGPSSLTDLIYFNVMASDFKTGKNLWNFTISATNVTVITLDQSNIHYLNELSSLSYGYGNFLDTADKSIEYNQKHPEFQNLNKSAIGPWKIEGAGTISMLPADNVVYISYYMQNYEYPASQTPLPYDDGSEAYRESIKYYKSAIFNRSELAYTGGILALDSNGRMLWNKPTDTMITAMAMNNSTIYYGTGDGKLSATQVNIAVGFVLAALAYLFLRFVCVGAVARAKARLSMNDNRNRVLEFIAGNPASSLYEIARGTGVNLGTVRYHLFILGLNHKIVASQTDGKYVRYFTNSGTYSKEEQLILSLMRRDAMGRVLGLMLEKPGISNAQIARELDIRESVVSRCVKELSEKGVIAREPAGRGCSVEESKREHVMAAMRRLYGE